MIHRVLDLDDLSVREIMKPRRDIVSVSASATLDEILKTMVESQHSRLPVWEDKPEQIVGAVFFKDMLRLWHERRVNLRAGRPAPPFYLAHIMRKPLIVPETKPLMQMLEEFRQQHSHMAMVVDEFGTVTGLLTVEDVLEQIVGEIEDEFDEKLPKALDAGGSRESRRRHQHPRSRLHLWDRVARERRIRDHCRIHAFQTGPHPEAGRIGGIRRTPLHCRLHGAKPHRHRPGRQVDRRSQNRTQPKNRRTPSCSALTPEPHATHGRPRSFFC